VTLYSGKIEMGQGVMTSLTQMAAEELGVALDAISIVMGRHRLLPLGRRGPGARSPLGCSGRRCGPRRRRRASSSPISPRSA